MIIEEFMGTVIGLRYRTYLAASPDRCVDNVSYVDGAPQGS